jgi:hypothetical protein
MAKFYAWAVKQSSEKCGKFLVAILERSSYAWAVMKKKNKAAQALGKLGGLKGGKARAAALTPERRKEIASKAAKARWGNQWPEFMV